jgi:hypothetical protein
VKKLNFLKNILRRLEQDIVDYQEQVTVLEAIVESHPDLHDEKGDEDTVIPEAPSSDSTKVEVRT